MALHILCDYCKSELNDPGGLLFSPPDRHGRSNKYHICKICFHNFTIGLSKNTNNKPIIEYISIEEEKLL